MSNRRAWLFIAILVLSLVAGCGEAEPAATPPPTAAPIVAESPTNTAALPPTATVAPSPTATSGLAPATSTAETEVVPPAADGFTIQVPAGAPPSLDGALGPDEWAGAYQDQLSDGGELYLMQDGDYVYVGIRAKRRGQRRQQRMHGPRRRSGDSALLGCAWHRGL